MVAKKAITLPKGTKVPDHVAVILDGNGRWARSRGLPVTQGHEAGATAIRQVLETCREIGVHTLTIWGFSTENWKRPPKEVAKIMDLVRRTIKDELHQAKKEGVRFVHLGKKEGLPKELVGLLVKAEKETKNNKKYILNLAINYGGRDEIIRAIRRIIKGNVDASKVDEKLFASYLDTGDQPYPYPDLLIRTSGEQRTSGFLPWQMGYTEFYFEEDHLPDMTPEKLRVAILDYSCRRRRHGAKDKVAHFKFKPAMTAKLELNWWRLQNIPEGTRFRDYAIEHLSEQWGLSKSLAKDAAKLMAEAFTEGQREKWDKAGTKLRKFYRLIKDEVKLAFEPSLAASLRVQLMQKINGGQKVDVASEVEDTTRRYLSEVYRISDFQAAKAAHLRALATRERALAEQGEGDEHWKAAEEYLQKYYLALKDRVA